MKAEVKGQLCEVSSLCPCLYGFWGLNSGLQTCAAIAFIPEPSHQLSVLSFLNKPIYICVCVCFMFTCELIHTPTCLHKEARNQPWVSLPLTEGFLLAWNFPVRPERLTRTFREFLYLPNAGLTIIHHTWPFFSWVLGIKVRSLCLQGKAFSDRTISSAKTDDFNVKDIKTTYFHFLKEMSMLESGSDVSE